MQKPLSSYGIIGNCRSSALISDEGAIEFGTFPDFDSPAYFCSILDQDKGGYFKVSPEGFYQTHQQYLENTNLLETLFFNQVGTVSITDFMPLTNEQNDFKHTPEFGTKIVRLIKSIKGDHNINLKIKITPDFAQEKVKITDSQEMVVFEDSKYKLILHKKHHPVRIHDDTVRINFRLNEGEQEIFALDFYPKDVILDQKSPETLNSVMVGFYFKTIEFWQNWASLCTYQGPYRAQVLRSALTLKLLTFSPTGAIVASPITSLPEKIGGELNWDYRYTWLRDASFTIYAFLGLGYIREAEDFINWLERVCLKEDSMVKIMYGIRGEENITEKTLDHLDGYMGSKPVRIGNAASDQKQFDVFGEVLVSLNLYITVGGKLSSPMKQFVKRLVNYCCTHWTEKDTGIWEGRDGEKHNTYSKLMCWVGVDRGIEIAKKLKIEGVDLEAWEKTAAEIKADILEHGFNKDIKSFVAYYESDVLDTSTLNIAISGMLPADDPRMLSTIDNIMRKLVIDWFVLRTSDTENKLQEGEGTFFLSTFWLIDCLSLLGRVAESKVWLEKLIHDATPLGLYAEEFDPLHKRHLGNFPQAFTHLGLINSVLNLKQAEAFGSETKATNQAERLFKVVKSVFDGKMDPKTLAHKTIKQLFSLIAVTTPGNN